VIEAYVVSNYHRGAALKYLLRIIADYKGASWKTFAKPSGTSKGKSTACENLPNGLPKARCCPHGSLGVREHGFDVFDDWHASWHEADTHWRNYESLVARASLTHCNHPLLSTLSTSTSGTLTRVTLGFS
jgi:hypothetical protein